LRLTSRHLGGRGRDVPSPCLRVSPGTVFGQRVDQPPPPGRFAASSRPLYRGRAVSGDSPDTVHGKETGFHGAFGETDKSLPPPWHRIDGESPPWGRRLDGEGGGGYGSPLPCLLCLWLNGIHRLPPPPGRYRGLLPPPARGGGQCLAIAPDSRARGGNRIFGEFLTGNRVR